MRCSVHRRGFTLVELLVTLALVAILLNVAAPSFVDFQRNAELTSRANTLLASLNAARGEAMKRNRSAMVSPLDQKKWESGWIVYVDEDGSKTFNPNTDTVLQQQNAMPGSIRISANGSADPARANPYILYMSSGFPEVPGNNLTFTIERTDVADAAKAGQVRRLIIANTGRVRVCKPLSNTDSLCLPG
jgi:type IV fimbrial biogenesis protein FimT